jgi:hypothetical protein
MSGFNPHVTRRRAGAPHRPHTKYAPNAAAVSHISGWISHGLPLSTLISTSDRNP